MQFKKASLDYGGGVSLYINIPCNSTIQHRQDTGSEGLILYRKECRDFCKFGMLQIFYHCFIVLVHKNEEALEHAVLM